MIYNSWTVRPNILMRLSSVPHECWGCIDTFLGFLRMFVRFSCNLYFRFFQCIFLIYVYKLKSAISALFWTVLVSVNQEFL